MRVAAFTGGVSVPSARFRVRQYVPLLAAQGLYVEELPCRLGKYPPDGNISRLAWGTLTFVEQCANAARTWSYDAVLLQREIISTLISVESLTRTPRVLDVDDAIYLFRGGAVARRLAKLVEVVVCGNEYLAAWFRQFHDDVRVIPTGVDTRIYMPRRHGDVCRDEIVLGWIGTSSNFEALYSVENALACVLQRFPHCRVRVISDRKPSLSSLPTQQFEFVHWSEATEVSSIQGIDIGLMPLIDTEWARGKCSFKMIQYMACGVPSVVSPVGMNRDVLALGRGAFAATDEQEWIDALGRLIASPELRASMGETARQIAYANFDIERLAPKLGAALRDAHGKCSP